MMMIIIKRKFDNMNMKRDFEFFFPEITSTSYSSCGHANFNLFSTGHGAELIHTNPVDILA